MKTSFDLSLNLLHKASAAAFVGFYFYCFQEKAVEVKEPEVKEIKEGDAIHKKYMEICAINLSVTNLDYLICGFVVF